MQRSLLSTFPGAQMLAQKALRQTCLAAYVLPGTAEQPPHADNTDNIASASANAASLTHTSAQAAGLARPSEGVVRLAEPANGGTAPINALPVSLRPATASGPPNAYTPRSIKVARAHPSQRPVSSSGALGGPFVSAQFLRRSFSGRGTRPD